MAIEPGKPLLWEDVPVVAIDMTAVEDLALIEYLNIEGCMDDGVDPAINTYDFPCGLSVSYELAHEKPRKGTGRMLYDAHRRHHWHEPEREAYQLLEEVRTFGNSRQVKIGCECEYYGRLASRSIGTGTDTGGSQ